MKCPQCKRDNYRPSGVCEKCRDEFAFAVIRGAAAFVILVIIAAALFARPASAGETVYIRPTSTPAAVPGGDSSEVAELRREIVELRAELSRIRGSSDHPMFSPTKVVYPEPEFERPKITAYTIQNCPGCVVLKSQRDMLESWADVEWVDGGSPTGWYPCVTWQDESGQTWYDPDGWDGQATVRLIKDEIYVPLSVPDTSQLPPEAQPTPYNEVHEALNLANLDASKTFADLGCGFDARFCIEATKLYGCRSIGIEIDHDRAESARRYVEASGYGDRITIIEGDAADVDFSADVAVVFLWTDELERMKPKLESINTVIALHHPVPGMEMRKSGVFFVRQSHRPQREPRYRQDEIVARWGGRDYTMREVRAYLRGCGTCEMCRSLRRQTGL